MAENAQKGYKGQAILTEKNSDKLFLESKPRKLASLPSQQVNLQGLKISIVPPLSSSVIIICTLPKRSWVLTAYRKFMSNETFFPHCICIPPNLSFPANKLNTSNHFLHIATVSW